MYANIRQHTRSQEFSAGLQSVNVPQDTLTSGNSSFNFLQHPPPEVLWEMVIDREVIEKQLLTYNRDSFRAAATSPCGHGVIHDELTFTGLSPTATGLLKGHIPENWQATDAHLQAFLASFPIPAKEQSSLTIDTTDVSRGFQQWREKLPPALCPADTLDITRP